MCTTNLKKLLITTTVPETLHSILGWQPKYLSDFFEVSLATSAGQTIEEIRQRECVPVAEVPMVRRIDPVADARALIAMIVHIRKVGPHLVHSYTPKAGLITMLAAWICRVPVRIHTFTGLLFPTAKGASRLLYMMLDRLICMCATHVVPEGEGVRKDLMQAQITKKEIEVVGHGNIAGVDTSHFSKEATGIREQACALRAKLGIGDDCFLFCFIGRLNRDKGMVELIHAFKSLPSKAHLIIVGAIDASAPVDKSVLREIVAHDRIHHLGYRNDVRPALAASDVLVLPSYREGFPNVILQAGAMHLPTIASDINGCNEVIAPGRNGWLVPPRSIPTLTSAMESAMMADRDVLEQMGQEARHIIQERFERSNYWERIREFYAGCILGV